MDTEENIRAEYAACGVYEDLDSSTDGDETFGFKESKLSPNKTTASMSQNSGSLSRKVSQFRDLRRHSDDISGRVSDNSSPFVEAISEWPDLRAKTDPIADSACDDPQLNGASDNETEISEDGIISLRINTHVDEEVEEDDDIAEVVYQVDDIHPEVSGRKNALRVVESIQNKEIECPYNFNDGGRDDTDESAYDSEEFECDGDDQDQEAMIRSHIIASDEAETSTREIKKDGPQDSEQVHEGVMTCDSAFRMHEKNRSEEGSLCEIADHNAEVDSSQQIVDEVCDRLISSAASMSMHGAQNRMTHKLSAENNGRNRGNIDKQSNNIIEKEKHVNLSALSSIRNKNITDTSIPAGNVSLYDLACNGSPQHVEGIRTSTSYIATYPYPCPYPCPRPPSSLRDTTNLIAEASASAFSVSKVQEMMSNYRSVAHHKNSLNPNRNVLKEKKQGYVSRIQQQSNKETAVRLLKGRVDAAMMKKRTNIMKCVRDRAVNGATPHSRTNCEYDNNDHSNESCNYYNNADDNDDNYKMNNKSNCKDNNSNENKINDNKNRNKNNDKCNTNKYGDIRVDHTGGRQTNTRDFDKSNSKTIIDRSRDRGRERSRSRSRVRDCEGASRQRLNQDDDKQCSNTPQKFAPTSTRSPVRTVMPARRSSLHLSQSPVRQLRGIVAGRGVTKHPMLVKRSLVHVEGFQLRDLNDR